MTVLTCFYYFGSLDITPRNMPYRDTGEMWFNIKLDTDQGITSPFDTLRDAGETDYIYPIISHIVSYNKVIKQ